MSNFKTIKMKTLFLGVISIIILFVSGCQKEELEPVLEKNQCNRNAQHGKPITGF